MRAPRAPSRGSGTPADFAGDVTAAAELFAAPSAGRAENKEVAALRRSGLSTVETHRAKVMPKLNLHNTAGIVLYAVRKGIIA
jgi:two-component system response regulator NreC